MPDMMVGNIVATSTVLARRDALMEQPLWIPEHMKMNEDMHLWLRLAASHGACVLPEPLIFYRLRQPGKYDPEQMRRDKAEMFEELLNDPVTGPKIRRYRGRFYSNMYFRVAIDPLARGYLVKGLGYALRGVFAQPTNLLGIARLARDAVRSQRQMNTGDGQ